MTTGGAVPLQFPSGLGQMKIRVSWFRHAVVWCSGPGQGFKLGTLCYHCAALWQGVPCSPSVVHTWKALKILTACKWERLQMAYKKILPILIFKLFVNKSDRLLFFLVKCACVQFVQVWVQVLQYMYEGQRTTLGASSCLPRYWSGVWLVYAVLCTPGFLAGELLRSSYIFINTGQGIWLLHMDSRIKLRSLGLSDKCFYPISHFAGPRVFKKNCY